MTGLWAEGPNRSVHCRALSSHCPQHDVLFDELTPTEQLSLVGILRGIGPTDLAAEVGAALEEVNLAAEAHVQVGKFSGGMKRRLSVVLATIGKPSVTILDEPTTGLDPINRHFVSGEAAVAQGTISDSSDDA
jgi:ABC-type multidrug transport system ATPase subunit